MHKIILGSASPRRKKILKDMGYQFEVVTADVDEKAIRLDDPKELVLALANAKADAIVPKLDKDSILITADTVVEFQGQIIEKPETKEEARKVLESYRDLPVYSVTAIVVTNTKTGKRTEGVDKALVVFKPFAEALFSQFIDSGIVLEHAGSFAVEREMFKPYIKEIEKLDTHAGLPIELTKRLIDDATK